MKILFDVNVFLRRNLDEKNNDSLLSLYNYLNKCNYIKYIHSVSFKQKLQQNKNFMNYINKYLNDIIIIEQLSSIADDIYKLSNKVDVIEADWFDSLLLNELFNNKVDFLISDEKKIHKKADLLGLNDRVFSINSFYEKIISENPQLVDYSVLSVKKELFCNVNLDDLFFDSFKSDYFGFEKWFLKKKFNTAYVTVNSNHILSFLYLKIENEDENYSNIYPVFQPKKRLKIGTFKVADNGFKLGERFLKIIFDNAIEYNVEEIYVTIFLKRFDQKRLVSLLEEWGFIYYGIKKTIDGIESVYVRNFQKNFNMINPKICFPFFSTNSNAYICPIHPKYHTDLLPDSILNNELSHDYFENQPHRNAIRKVYVSRSKNRNIKIGDILIFYRTAPLNQPGYYYSVITTIGIVESIVKNVTTEEEFILKCKKRSVFTDKQLRAQWDYNPNIKPFIINFLSNLSFTHRLNRKTLLDLGIITGDKNELRGLKPITKNQLKLVLKETKTNESIIVD